MARRPKGIGTAFESQVVNFLRADGWDDCERLALAGNRDRGDIIISRHPIVVAECKAGAQAEAASAAVIDLWLAECHTERDHAAAVLCPLIVNRRRRNVSRSDAWLPLSHLVWIDSGRWGTSHIPVRMSLADFSALLRAAVKR